MKILCAILFLSISFNAGAQRISLQDYYPLVKGTKHTYYISSIVGNDTFTNEPSASYCKSIEIQGRQIFYFEDVDTDQETSIVSADAFSQGVFYYKGGAFWYSPIFWKQDLVKANLDYFEALFPEKIKLNSIYKYKDGEKLMKFSFTGFETIQVKGKTFDHCLKLRLECDWPAAKNIDWVWFEKGFGVVKWLRSTGRLEEIKQ